MKKHYEYKIKGKRVKKEYKYIPLRYIISMAVIVAEIVLIIGLVMLAFYYTSIQWWIPFETCGYRE